MVDMGNSFRKIMKQSWDFELAENTAFTYCLTKAAIHFNIKFDYFVGNKTSATCDENIFTLYHNFFVKCLY